MYIILSFPISEPPNKTTIPSPELLSDRHRVNNRSDSVYQYMEGVGARLGRSSTRYGPATVFTGPVRKWKKKWIHVTPSNTTTTAAAASNNHHHQQPTVSSNGNSSSNGGNENGAHLLLYKWTPISQSQSQNNGNGDGDGKDDDSAAEVDEEPPRRKIKYIPIALLEEQKKELSEEHIEEPIETELNALADPNLKVDGINGKPDINDVPMEENQVSEEMNVGRQDLNENTLDLNARDEEEEEEEEDEETKEEAR